MKKNNVLEHPLIAQLESLNLKSDELSWELNVLAVSVIEEADSRFLDGIEDYSNLQLLLDRVTPLYKECCSLEMVFPENQVVSHNMEILLVVTMSSSMNLISRPQKKVS